MFQTAFSTVDCTIQYEEGTREKDICIARWRLESFLSESMIGPARVIIEKIKTQTYETVAAFAVLFVLANYWRIGRDKTLGAVFAGLCAAIATGTLVYLVMGGVGGHIPFSETLLYATTFTAFFVVVLAMLRRRLSAKRQDILDAGLLMLIASMMGRLMYDLDMPVDWIKGFFTSIPFLGALDVDTIAYWDAIKTRLNEEANGMVAIKSAFEGYPFCTWNAPTDGARTCIKMDLVLNYTLRFVCLLGLATLVRRWTLDVRRVLVLSVFLLILAPVVVNAVAAFEILVTGRTFLLADIGLPQSIMLAAVTYILARYPIRRRPASLTRAGPIQSTVSGG